MQENVIDVTETVEVYENGKTWDCECGHGIGTDKDVRRVRCHSCGEILEDAEASVREDEEPVSGDAPNVDSGQTKLGEFA